MEFERWQTTEAGVIGIETTTGEVGTMIAGAISKIGHRPMSSTTTMKKKYSTKLDCGLG
jgi:hypothetical protein